ncbi:hypothetical protein E3T25_01820 [Cryobacterium sandaracinum]|uniref:Uncharacterized protein n=1 Tax=Cryobacterium sandaracinum TaxID=1259247 RepID=A0ABY2JLX9_9MICO|nr:hypothetical protein [Cryobacterium sandaracinum]TFD06874.1 hypothetical protein E3T25_01820 [Cryobacterium sandaracinum]
MVPVAEATSSLSAAGTESRSVYRSVGVNAVRIASAVSTPIAPAARPMAVAGKVGGSGSPPQGAAGAQLRAQPHPSPRGRPGDERQTLE